MQSVKCSLQMVPVPAALLAADSAFKRQLHAATQAEQGNIQRSGLFQSLLCNCTATLLPLAWKSHCRMAAYCARWNCFATAEQAVHPFALLLLPLSCYSRCRIAAYCARWNSIAATNRRTRQPNAVRQTSPQEPFRTSLCTTAAASHLIQPLPHRCIRRATTNYSCCRHRCTSFSEHPTAQQCLPPGTATAAWLHTVPAGTASQLPPPAQLQGP